MKNEIKTETKNSMETENSTTTQTQPSAKLPKQNRIKKWMLNLIAVAFGFVIICGILGTLDILAQKELKKTGDALPKLFLYRWKSN
ncbi:MAG: hypothetical protein LBB88_12040, partial [Planctomycetaceae bacterium]|nr:hypothetical protein [Planctomycetaceae bacterium]